MPFILCISSLEYNYIRTYYIELESSPWLLLSTYSSSPYQQLIENVLKQIKQPHKFSLTDAYTWHHANVPQLCSLPAEILRLHLTARNLVSAGNKSVMAQ